MTVKINGEKKSVRKYLLSDTLKNLFNKFQIEYPEVKIGFSKFVELRPKNCKFVGCKNMHAICLCIACENPRLMIATSLLGDLTAFAEIVNKIDGSKLKLEDIVVYVSCEKKDDECADLDCQICSDRMKDIFGRIKAQLEDLNVEEIEYEQWKSDDYSRMWTVNCSTEEFCGKLEGAIRAYLKHLHINKNQSWTFSNFKKNVPEKSAVVQMDFSENYTFKYGAAIQANYFKQPQCTLFVACIWVNTPEKKSSNPDNLVMITENLTHDTNSVFRYMVEINKYLQRQVIFNRLV